MRVFGIKSCDTVRRALKELAAAGVAPTFVDIRENQLKAADFERFHSAFGAALINRRSTTWRGLDEAERAQDPVRLLLAYPTLMKRPVIEDDGGKCTLGWDQAARAVWL